MLRILLILLSFGAYAQNIQLIDWFAGADIVGTTGNSDAELESSFYVREFEFSAMSRIDQNWNGILTLSKHKEIETEHDEIEIHEAVLSSSNIINLTNIRLGKFFLGFGRINQFHRHDWYFTDAPMVQKAFFGNEGAKDTGVEVKRNLLGLGSTLTLGLTNGNEFDHTNHSDAEENGQKKEHDHSKGKSPIAYARFAKFYEFTTTRGFEIALNAINRKDEESVLRRYYGLDFVYKNRFQNFLETLFQGEVWVRESSYDDEKHNDYGAYLYYQKAFDQHHAIGLRLDYFKMDEHDHEGEDHDHGIDGIAIHESYEALSASYIYSNSEFMKTRFTAEHILDIEDVGSVTRGFIQLVFNIGAHPSHVY